MLFVIFCVDKPESAQVRATTRPAHLEFIKGLGDRVKVAGPMTTPDGTSMTGSMLVIEAGDLAEARAIAASDPYAQAGLFESAYVRPWRQAIPVQG